MIVRWRAIAPLRAELYRFLINRTAWWRHLWPRQPVPRPVTGDGRVVYYLASFPVLSQTFIQREVAGLLAAGVPLVIVAHDAADVAHLGAGARVLMAHARYLGPSSRRAVRWHERRFFRERPVRFIRLFLAVVLCKYRADKAYEVDRRTFRRAVHLAGALADMPIARLHSPWATVDAWVVAVAAQLLGVPHTVHARASDIHRNDLACGVAARLCGAECVITNSLYNEQFLRGLLHARNGRLTHIYNGINLDLFPGDNGGRSAGQHEVPRILCVARLIEAKGLEYLLHACRLLKDRGYRVRCDIIGSRGNMDVNYPIRLRKLCSALHLEEDVSFLGPQPFERVLEEYRRTDVFVLPSVVGPDGTGDVTPNVLIEAMAMKLPVISTRSRAIPEIVEDGVSGLLVPPADAAALAEALMRLLRDPQLRVMLGNNARARVEERFDIRKNIPALAALLAAPNGPAGG